MAGTVSARLTDEPTRRELRSFALSVGGVLATLGAVLAWRGRPASGVAVAIAGLALLAAGLVVPARLGPVYRAWMAVALAISKVTTPLLMGIIYFGVVTPIGLAMRVLGRRVLSRPPDAATYWVDRPPGARRSDLRRQF